MRFNILFVCTGNICRSPMAEYMLRARLDPAKLEHVQVTSAGVRALTGHPIDSVAAKVLRERGIDAEAHEARQLDRWLIEQADLILTADSEHRSRVVRELPGGMRRIFTMREFARLGDPIGPPRPSPKGNRLVRQVATVASRRGVGETPAPGSDDVGDPYGGPVAVMEAAAAQIESAVDALCRILGFPQDG